jgi:ABC-type antimicrobial peptide transport system permease subunit
MQTLDPQLPLFEMGTLSERLSDGLARERQSSAVLSVFGGLAVLLATFGLYAVTASAARRREHEIGVRLALGARPQDALRLVLSQALLLVGLGLAAGLAGALAASRQLAHLLYGVESFDLQTFAAVSVLLAAATTAAVLLPAQRASQVDPVKALKAE